MNNYELTVIIDPDIAEEDVPNAIEGISELVKKNGGEVSETNQWGRRKLAYPIGNHREGNYVIAKLELEPSKAAELEANLNLSETYLRHLLIRLAD